MAQPTEELHWQQNVSRHVPRLSPIRHSAHVDVQRLLQAKVQLEVVVGAFRFGRVQHQFLVAWGG